MKDFLNLSIVELHECLLKGEISPKQLVNLSIDRAKNDDNNAFEYICEKEAKIELDELKNKNKNNLLWGIPYVLKDNISTKDIPTTASSEILKDYIPVFSSEVYLRLKQQGAILIGKTTLDELAMGGYGISGHLGKTYNPWDKTHSRIVGGSSSGSAAACAAGIVPFAIGSDTGDSARKPASYAGLVGFKPTWGRISRYGLFPFAPSLDHIGFFTRNVTDSAIVLSALAGKDEKDSTCSSKPVDDYVGQLQKDEKGLKIAIIDEIFATISDQNVRNLFINLITKLEKCGVIINHVSLSKELCLVIYPTYLILSSTEAVSSTANLDGIKFGMNASGNNFKDIAINSRSENLSIHTKKRLLIGEYALYKNNQQDLLLKAQKCRGAIVNRINEILKDNDFIILPAAPSVAPTFNQIKNQSNDEQLVAENFMAIANFGGYPSISIPLGFENNLPLGVNVTGNLFDESRLLAFSKKIEDMLGFKNFVAKNNE